ncbi:MAG: DEAD/DEAH box helicase [Porticoccaceae bacterium]|nr:DEAD/DEAH box helicase [Porticoccaceae bacterium]
MSFTTLGLSPAIADVLGEQGYSAPTDIQRTAIPAILSGRDLLAAAQTGTGKTASFALPILERLSSGYRAGANRIRALVLVPTRELAVQVCDNFSTYSKHLPLRTTAVYGGVKINPQMMAMRKGADILVATPGRLLDLYHSNALGFQQLQILVLDEADRMLDLGFAAELDNILAALPPKRQTLLFSATLSEQVRRLARTLVNNPVEIAINPVATTAATVKHWLCPVDKKKKPMLLRSLIKRNQWQQVLVFTKTRQGADKLGSYLTDQGIATAVIHGDKSQGARMQALADFKKGDAQILVATDVAARGLDIEQLPQVVNFDLPIVPQDYIHRIGRTGRAGIPGEAVSLVCADEFEQLCAIEQHIKKIIAREYIDGFEPSHDLPESKSIRSETKAKKPKKVKTAGQRSLPPGAPGGKTDKLRAPVPGMGGNTRKKPATKKTGKPGGQGAQRQGAQQKSPPKKSLHQNRRQNIGSKKPD